MKKINYILLLLIFAVGFTSFAQKVKVKVKDEIISANKIDVAKIIEVDEDNFLYTLEDLSGTKILDIQINDSGSSSDIFSSNWMTISSPNFKTKGVVDFGAVGMSTDKRSMLGLILGRKYGLFSENGINQSKLEDFFKIERTSNNKERRTGYGGSEMKRYAEGFDGKVKSKKGVITFDKAEIAKYTEQDSLISYSSSNNQLNVIYHNYLIEGELKDKRFKWLEISDNSRRSAEVRMEYSSDFGNDLKQITLLLAKAYNILTLNGVENLDEFYAIERPKLSGEYDEAMAAHQKMLDEIRAIVDTRRPLYKLSETGEITRTIDDEYLGRIILPKSLVMAKESATKIQVGERKDKKVLELTPVGSNIFLADFFGDDYYYFRSKNTSLAFNENKQELRSEILNFIIGKKKDSMLNLGYEEFKSIRKGQAIKRYKARKLVSPNINGQPGYVIDDEGEKWEGNISINFEELINPEKDDSAVFKNIVEIGGGGSKYGKEVQVEYPNKKGKTKNKTIKSSSGAEFHVGEQIYRGYKANVDGLEVAASAMALNFNYSSYYLVIAENEDIVLYKNPLTLAKGIKTKVQERGFNFITRNPERNFEKLKEYLGDCTNVPDSLKDIDYNKPESINTLIEYYKSSCK